MIPTKTAVLKQVTDLTHDVKEFIFHCELDLAFKAGQFVNFKIEDDQPGMCFRAYSVVRYSSDDKAFTLAIKMVPDGRGSTFLKNLNEGDSVQFIGPVGNFCIRDASKKLGLIATGTGIAPFISYLEDLVENNNDVATTLLWGVRHGEDIFYRDILDGFSHTLPNFSYFICTSQETVEGCLVGRTSAHYIEHFKEFSNADFYLCGNGKMIDQAKELLPEQLGVSAEHIFHEKFD